MLCHTNQHTMHRLQQSAALTAASPVNSSQQRRNLLQQNAPLTTTSGRNNKMDPLHQRQNGSTQRRPRHISKKKHNYPQQNAFRTITLTMEQFIAKAENASAKWMFYTNVNCDTIHNECNIGNGKKTPLSTTSTKTSNNCGICNSNPNSHVNQNTIRSKRLKDLSKMDPLHQRQPGHN